MSETEPPLDFTLRWEESEVADKARRGDFFSATLAQDDAVLAESSPARDDSDGWDEVKEVDPGQADGEDDFEWSAEREAELEEAFESIPVDAPARVHLQLGDIASGLKEGALAKPRALALLFEVERYLTTRIKAEERKPPVDHELFMSYRADKLNALYAWQETATALREFCICGDQVQLRVACYAADQASDFLHKAWETLQSAEPVVAPTHLEGADVVGPSEIIGKESPPIT